MILTCPECATRYFVPDDKVGPDGRTVKCSSCGNRWTARAEPDLELFVDADEGAVAREPVETPIVEPAVSALPGEELPKVFRQKADTDRRVREAATTGIVWASMAVALTALVGTAVIFRVNVVKLWPGAASAYAAVGLNVNALGLTIENLEAEAALEDGHAALAVTGIIRNVQDRATVAPALRIVLLNKAEKVVAVKVATPADPKIPPGGVRHFVVTLIDPPTTAAFLDATFELEPTGKPARARVSPAHPLETRPPALRGAAEPTPPPGPAPVEARALPEGAPEALHKPEETSH